jgi:integrase/recombinase XerC
VKYLREEKLWSIDDPIFPATRIEQNAERQFEAVGLDRKHWSSAAAIPKIFREAFESAGLPYFNPHSFRNTLVRLGETVCRNPEAFKAWSQNLGHEKVLTTFYSYGEVGNQRQGEIIRDLAKPQQTEQTGVTEIAKAVVRELRQSRDQQFPVRNE